MILLVEAPVSNDLLHGDSVVALPDLLPSLSRSDGIFTQNAFLHTNYSLFCPIFFFKYFLFIVCHVLCRSS